MYVAIAVLFVVGSILFFDHLPPKPCSHSFEKRGKVRVCTMCNEYQRLERVNGALGWYLGPAPSRSKNEAWIIS